MTLESRLRRLEQRIPGGGRRITQIIETIVDEKLAPVAVIRETVDSGTVEYWEAPHIPEPLPADVDAAAVERATKSLPFTGASPALG